MRPHRFITRRRLKDLADQDYENFKAHWRMRLFDFVVELMGNTLFGVLLGLSLVVYVLQAHA